MVERKAEGGVGDEDQTYARSMLDAAHDAFIGIDASGHITEWNPAAERTFGWRREEVLGTALVDTVIPSAHRRAHEEGLARFLMTGEARVLNRRIELVGRHKDGREFPLDATITSIKRGGSVEFGAFLRDNTERKAAADKLAAFLDSIVENVPAMIFVKDASELRFELFNRAGEELLGVPRASLIGKNDRDFFPEEQAEHFQARDHETLREGKLVDIAEEPILTARGERWLHTQKIPVLDEAGNPRYLLGISVDITDRKIAQERLRESEARYQRLADGALEGIALVRDGRFFDANRAFCEMYGYTHDELVGQDELVVVAPESRASLIAHRRDRAEQVFEVEGLRKDGTRFFAEGRDRSISFEKGECHIVAVRDVSAHRTALAELAEANRELLALERMKSEFVGMVSHELRTPLTSILGALGLVCGGAAGELSPRARTLMQIARTNGERLARLVGDLLDMEKLQSGAMEFRFQTVELWPVVERAMIANTAYASQLGVRFVAEGDGFPASIHADPERLEQVVTNLLSNAAKFSPPAEVVHVSMTRQGSRLRVEITDRGPGIPAEFVPRIFQRFAQSGSPDTRGKGGTGLGLNISKLIVERLGGTIGFTAASPKGTTFYFELPELAASPPEG